MFHQYIKVVVKVKVSKLNIEYLSGTEGIPPS